ncbi:sigma-70 family RNA polymerase sigma factor [Sphingobacterium phlebotomi]|uniref:Sigma-70 family RNA polymerase sigma factor n=1 Tax=Sphingobacterium phlebotomi TaxID=2605433 RepID=A0A5D4H3B8_9SPHI|nr:sigma-70 family RNA polymerase sigma factor [Sphingobacterium phlebotomi]TYR35107.1 sigma-70 family RNA polymerase sigma factor [Sphingobacterium phlebotomi]
MPTLIDKEVLLLSRIRNGDDSAIDEIYRTSKIQFLTFARKLLNDENSLEDIYQDTVIAFYENVRTGKITALKSSITTYIIGIGKHILYRHLKKAKTMSNLDEIDEFDLGAVTNTYIEQIADKETTIILQQAIEKLGEPCASLLRLFYYEEKENTEIATLLGYANADVIKSQKYRCMQTLKAIMKKVDKNDR